MKLNEFKESIKSGSFLVDFYTTWCVPCKLMAKKLESFKGKVPILKIDAEESAEITNAYKIGGVPTLIFFKDGQALDRIEGVASDIVIEESIKKIQ